METRIYAVVLDRVITALSPVLPPRPALPLLLAEPKVTEPKEEESPPRAASTKRRVFRARHACISLFFYLPPPSLSLSFSLRSLAGRSDEGLPSPSLLRSIVATRRSRRLQLESGTCPRWWTGFATTLAQSPSPMQFFHCDRWSNHLVGGDIAI